jgi:DNA-binding NtrC family response regulator
MACILVVDDEAAMRITLALPLRQRGHQVSQAASLANGLAQIRAEAFDLVLTDLRLGDGDGLEILKAVKESCPEVEVILMTAYGSVESAVEAMKLGAFDYLLKPFNPEELFLRVDKALERVSLRREVANLRSQVRERFTHSGIVSQSSAMQKVLEMVSRVAQSDTTVLIEGESGTGKELIAKAIHHQSPRARGPFVAINCGALPEPLLESELFGHVKGAFTGAIAHKMGLFEEANGGTVLLDEIGETPLPIQVKLLRVLQERQVRRVGSNTSTAVNIRILAATNKHLSQLVRTGAFREDLYYRLNVIPFALPPLRQRPEDIPLLAMHFLKKYATDMGKTMPSLPADTLDLLTHYPWPGNVRELENVMERAVVLTSDTITPADLPVPVRRGILVETTETPGQEGTTSEIERAHILDTVIRCDGNLSRAAETLGIGRTTLWRKLKRYRGEDD